MAFIWKTSEVQAVVPAVAGVQPRDALTTVKAVVVQMGARVQRISATGQLRLRCTENSKVLSEEEHCRRQLLPTWTGRPLVLLEVLSNLCPKVIETHQHFHDLARQQGQPPQVQGVFQKNLLMQREAHLTHDSHLP